MSLDLTHNNTVINGSTTKMRRVTTGYNYINILSETTSGR